jgi:hypothetical protein
MAHTSQTLDELLADPMIQAVMRADRVEPAALKDMLTGVADRLNQRRLDLTGARFWFCGQSRPASAPKLWPQAKSGEDRVCC